MEEHVDGLKPGLDGHPRCFWCTSDPLYEAYHDNEWGRPLTDDFRIYEKICLEGFQSGLSWLTILRKREKFREAFDDFNFEKVALYTDDDVERLLTNEGIIRHRRKIESAINNAQRALEMRMKFGALAPWFWRFAPEETDRPPRIDIDTLMQLNRTAESQQMSRELKRLGWSFVGPTTAYAFMQSAGLVNDHLEGCCLRPIVEQENQTFSSPVEI